MTTLNIVILLFDENICSTTVYSSNFLAYRTDVAQFFHHPQSLNKRIGVVQDRNDSTIQKTSSETNLCQILPWAMSRVSKFMYGSLIHIAYEVWKEALTGNTLGSEQHE